MHKKNKSRNIKEVEKIYYNFNIEEEKNIYMYLCGKHIKRKVLKKIDNKFHTYREWKNYIRDKYCNLPKDELIEFKHLLCQNMRNIKPETEYWNLVIPVMVTMLINAIFGYLEEVDNSSYNKIQLRIEGILFIIVIISWGVMMLKIIAPLWKNNEDENFYKDYIEVIEEIINEK